MVTGATVNYSLKILLPTLVDFLRINALSLVNLYYSNSLSTAMRPNAAVLITYDSGKT